MKVYIFLGTHLLELSHCLSELVKLADSQDPLQIFVPTGWQWPDTAPENSIRQSYESGNVHWRFNKAAQATIFIVLDPGYPQVPQIESLAESLRAADLEPVKVISLVDTRAAESSPQYRTWLEANIYYSDIVLLGNRSQTSKSFLRDFQKAYEKKCFPCQFLLLKGPGSPVRPLEILAPYTRRLAQIFDLPEPELETVSGVILEASCDLELEEPEIDPYRPTESDESESAPPLPDVSEWVVDSRTRPGL